MVNTIDIDVITKAAKSVKAISELVESALEKSDVRYLVISKTAGLKEDYSKYETETITGLKMSAAALNALKYQLRQNMSGIQYLLFEIESLSKTFNVDADTMNFFMKEESHA